MSEIERDASVVEDMNVGEGGHRFHYDSKAGTLHLDVSKRVTEDNPRGRVLVTKIVAKGMNDSFEENVRLNADSPAGVHRYLLSDEKGHVREYTSKAYLKARSNGLS